MSESAKSLRSAMKNKAMRLTKADPKQKVDSSDWTPAEELKADVKTGMRPVSRRAFKKGGKVIAKCEGGMAKGRADRKPRASGGKLDKYIKAAETDVRGKRSQAGKQEKAAYRLFGSKLHSSDPKSMKMAEGLQENAINKSKKADRREAGIALAKSKLSGESMKYQGDYNPLIKEGETAKVPARASGGKLAKYVKAANADKNYRAMQNEEMNEISSEQANSMPRREFEAMDREIETNANKIKNRGKGINLALKKLTGNAKVPARASGGKVEQPLVDRYVNRDLKKANEYRDGEKHVGGLKTGGRTKKFGGGGIGDNPLSEQSKMMGNAAMPRKSGGRTKKAVGGMTMEEMIDKNPAPKKEPEFKAPNPVPLPPRRKPEPTPKQEPEKADPRLIKAKKGGKISHMEWEHSKKDLEQDKKLAKKHGMSMEKWEKSKLDEKHDRQQSTKGLKRGGEVFSGKGYPEKVPGATGGRTARKSGGRAKKSRTNINIVIAAGKGQDQSGPPMMPPPGARGPGATPVPVPSQPPMAIPAGMPMAGAAGAPNMPPPSMGRKHGGKVYRSAKDMDAGAGSGEGRLEKTEIARHDRTGRKHGGKTYHSYKDVDAGAGSGEGRLEKTEIEKRKRLH